MGILDRLNRLDARVLPGAPFPGEPDLAWLDRIGRMRRGGGAQWALHSALARQVVALEKRVAELERRLAERS